MAKRKWVILHQFATKQKELSFTQKFYEPCQSLNKVHFHFDPPML